MTAKILAYLKQLPIIVYLVIAGISVAGGWFALNNAHQREIGKRDILISQLEITNRDLLHAKDSLAKQYKVDTLRLTRLRVVTDTMTNTVEVWKRDTLEVVRYVFRVDSTIKACTQALQTCEARVGVAQKGWDGARGEIAILKKQMPSAAKPWLYGLAGVGAGYLAGRLLK